MTTIAPLPMRRRERRGHARLRQRRPSSQSALASMAIVVPAVTTQTPMRSASAALIACPVGNAGPRTSSTRSGDGEIACYESADREHPDGEHLARGDRTRRERRASSRGTRRARRTRRWRLLLHPGAPRARLPQQASSPLRGRWPGETTNSPSVGLGDRARTEGAVSTASPYVTRASVAVNAVVLAWSPRGPSSILAHVPSANPSAVTTAPHPISARRGQHDAPRPLATFHGRERGCSEDVRGTDGERRRADVYRRRRITARRRPCS